MTGGGDPSIHLPTPSLPKPIQTPPPKSEKNETSAISMSLDQKEREREMVSRLLSDLYPDLLSTDDVVRALCVCICV